MLLGNQSHPRRREASGDRVQFRARCHQHAATHRLQSPDEEHVGQQAAAAQMGRAGSFDDVASALRHQFTNPAGGAFFRQILQEGETNTGWEVIYRFQSASKQPDDFDVISVGKKGPGIEYTPNHAVTAVGSAYEETHNRAVIMMHSLNGTHDSTVRKTRRLRIVGRLG